MTHSTGPILDEIHLLIAQIDRLQTKLRREPHLIGDEAGRRWCACGDGHCCAKHAVTFNLLDDAHRLLDKAADDLRKP